MRVEPTQLVRRTPTHSVAQDRLVWIKDGELFQEFLSLSQSVRMLEDDVAPNGARYGGNEFHNRLMRQAHRIFQNAAPEKRGCNLLIVRKTAIEPVDQNVCINESGHACKDPLFSNLFHEAALPGVLNAYGGVRWPGRTNGAAILDFPVSLVCLEERRESLHPLLPSQCYLLGGEHTVPRSSWGE